MDDDVFIQGVLFRNRALHGDVVIIQLLTGKELENEIQKYEKNRQEKRDQEEERSKKVAILEDEGEILPENDDLEDELEDDLEDEQFKDLNCN